jgi:hypothetical protein
MADCFFVPIGLSGVEVAVGTTFGATVGVAIGTTVSVGEMGVGAGAQEIKISAARMAIAIVLVDTSGSKSVIDQKNSHLRER